MTIAAVAATSAVATASIEPDFAAPVVLLSRYEVSTGEEIDVTIAGFTSRVVTVSVCGNRALRGSSDCGMTASESAKMNADGSSRVLPFVVSAPPTPCPCLVRVSSPGNDQVATAELTLIGHPVAEPVAGVAASQALTASLVVERADGGTSGWLKASLGGSIAYDVHLTIRNTSSDPVGRVAIDGHVGGGGGDVRAEIGFPNPGTIGAGDTWDRVVQVTLPAPVFGNANWTVDVSSDGPTVTASDESSHLPGLLILLIVVLVVDLLFLAARFARGSIRRSRDREGTVIDAATISAGAPVDAACAAADDVPLRVG